MRRSDSKSDEGMIRFSSACSSSPGRVSNLRYSTIVDVPLTRVLAKWLKHSGIVLLLPAGEHFHSKRDVVVLKL